jgi:hypothetical protein
MNTGELQQVVDRLAMVSSQRSVFGALAVVAAVAASAASAGSSGFVLVLVLGLAAAAASHPDSHAALLVEAVVVWQWVAGTHDATDPAVVAVASALFVFHTVIALMAVTPSSAVVGRVLVWRWLRRSGYVLVATGSMWLVVVVMVDRQAPGSVLLTFMAFATLAAFAVAIRTFGVTAGGRRRAS